jgi:hypothetical protein
MNVCHSKFLKKFFGKLLTKQLDYSIVPVSGRASTMIMDSVRFELAVISERDFKDGNECPKGQKSQNSPA